MEPPSSHRIDPRAEPQPPSRRIDPRAEPQPPSRRIDPRAEPQPPSRRIDPRAEPVAAFSRRSGPASIPPPPLGSTFDSSIRDSPEPPSTRLGPLSTRQGSAGIDPFDLRVDPRAEAESTPVPSTRREAAEALDFGAPPGSPPPGPEESTLGTRRRNRARRRNVERDKDALAFPVMEDANPTETPAGTTDVAPTAEGTLSRTPLAHLLVYMLDQGLTGRWNDRSTRSGAS
jgi:hypothetical protein